MSGSSLPPPPGGGAGWGPPPPGEGGWEQGSGDEGGEHWRSPGGWRPAPGAQGESSWGGPGWQDPLPGQQIPNYLVWSILSTVFCCLPAGIVSIVFAAQVGTKETAGDIAGALDASRKARLWAIISAALALVWIPIVLVLGLFGTLMSSG